MENSLISFLTDSFKPLFSRSEYFFNDSENDLYELKDNGSEYVITIDAKNFKKDNIDITVKNHVLNVHYKYEKTDDENSKAYSEFSYSYTIPSNCIEDNIEATVKGNDLVITIPKKNAEPVSDDGSKKILIK